MLSRMLSVLLITVVVCWASGCDKSVESVGNSANVTTTQETSVEAPKQMAQESSQQVEDQSSETIKKDEYVLCVACSPKVVPVGVRGL